MLQEEGLGVLILVYANAVMNHELYHQLEPALKQRFDHYQTLYHKLLSEGRRSIDPDDDLFVFLKMVITGRDRIKLVESRDEKGWELQFNHIRGFRPPRGADKGVNGNYAPFNENGFHFNKPFLRKETLWHGVLAGRQVDLLYNKFPFVENHLLLVPERERNAPQFLTKIDHNYIWNLSSELGEKIKGWGVGFNGYGAYSSINHLHFQAFAREKPLPIENPQWSHNGGEQPYPLAVLVYSDPVLAWEAIDSLHNDQQCYSLLYRKDRLYLIPRRCQSEYKHEQWTSGYAWYEVCGGVVTFNTNDYLELKSQDIQAEFQKLVINTTE